MDKQQERDRFYLERITGDVFKIRRKDRRIGTVVATGETGSLRYVAMDGKATAHGKTRKQAARRLLAEVGER